MEEREVSIYIRGGKESVREIKVDMYDNVV
jgi:hypothetical protein